MSYKLLRALKMTDKKDIVKREVRFAVHIPKNHIRTHDYHYVKEQVTYSDGTREPRVFLVRDFKKPVWLTKEAFRTYKEKKEFEDLEHLDKILATQSDIDDVVANHLGVGYLANKRDYIKNSPYVYGYDITSTSLIKFTSLKRNNFVQSPYTVASFDIETDPNTDEILLATVAFENKVFTAILKKFVKNITNLDYRLKEAVKYYLPQYENLEVVYKVCDNEVELIETIFQHANKLMPDFLTIWNMDFDIPKVLSRLKKYNANPIDVICDKTIPRELRICRYKQGIKKKVTASGVVKPINPSLQWHTLLSTTSFYVIDAMCTYRQLRMSKQEEPSYSLDYILQKELKSQKLKFKEADQYKGVNWHLFMQENYPIEYIVYNIYDCLGILELDNKTKDLTSTLPSFASISDFSRFNSNPKKIVDALFLFGLNKGRVIGTVGKVDDDSVDDSIEDTDDEDDTDTVDLKKYKTLDLKGWIQLLPQNLLLHEGLKCLEDYPDVVTNVRTFVFDFDSVSSYPSCTMVANVSKETTKTEIVNIEGVKEEVFREMNLAICLGNTNMLEYFEVMFNMPSVEKLLDLID